MLGICFHFLLDYGNISFLVFWGAELGYKAVTKIGHGKGGGVQFRYKSREGCVAWMRVSILRVKAESTKIGGIRERSNITEISYGHGG